MFGNLTYPIRSSLGRGIPNFRRLRVCSLLAIFIFTLTSAGRIEPAGAAPLPQDVTVTEKDFSLVVSTPTSPICVGKDSDIPVLAKGRVYIPYKETNLVEIGSVVGIKVEAIVKNSSIAEIKPQKLITGWANAIESETSNAVTFKLHPKKAGKTDVYFEAFFPQAKDTPSHGYASATLPIEVVKCKYKAKMAYLMQQSSHGTFGMVAGFIDATLKGDGETYSGSGTLDNSRTENMAPCTFSSDGFQSATTITAQSIGSEDDGQLELTMNYEPAQSSSTISCPHMGTKENSTSENPSEWLATSVTLPENGGSVAFPISYAQWYGTLTINLIPEDESAPVSVNTSGETVR